MKCLKEHKAAGPDNVSPRLLKNCSAELAPVFYVIFNWSIQICKVPSIYKFSKIIPVPKKTNAEVFNDFRPVALTSCIMKCFERVVLKFIKSLLPADFDPYQFAYRENRCIEDALSITIHEILQHLESANTYARILFIDFSSAFNTIIPQQLYNKLCHELHFPTSICNWILDFLLNRPQVVKIGNVVSSTIILSTGTPQGCVISPTLYSIFTYDLKTDIPNTLLVKFADDATGTGLIQNCDETHYRTLAVNIKSWCDINNLDLNVIKTKEMIIDFRKDPPPLEPLLIDYNIPVEQVSIFKFLGSFVNNDLTWENNCDQKLKAARQRIYFLRSLNSM